MMVFFTLHSFRGKPPSSFFSSSICSVSREVVEAAPLHGICSAGIMSNTRCIPHACKNTHIPFPLPPPPPPATTDDEAVPSRVGDGDNSLPHTPLPTYIAGGGSIPSCRPSHLCFQPLRLVEAMESDTLCPVGRSTVGGVKAPLINPGEGTSTTEERNSGGERECGAEDGAGVNGTQEETKGTAWGSDNGVESSFRISTGSSNTTPSTSVVEEAKNG